jgi:hypothetical protein
LELASSLGDELQRAVQNRLENFLFYFKYFFSFINRAAQDRETDLQETDNFFQAVNSPEKVNQSNNLFEYNQQQSLLTRSLSSDKSSLRESFQRIKIAGDLHDMSHIEDLDDAVSPLLRALVIRETYFIILILNLFIDHIFHLDI